MLCLLAVLLLLTPALALADDEFRDDFNDASAWVARSDWLGPSTDNPVLEVADGIAHFAVAEPERGMKWRRDCPQVYTDFTPWLVIRYRTEHYAADTVDYLFWLGDSAKGRDGLRLIRGDLIRADGRWHTQAFDLMQAGVVPPVNAMALQCFATEAGNASLWVDYIIITDTPPEDAEGVEKMQGDGQTWPVEMSDPKAWTVQPDWLANYTENHACEATDNDTRFSVAEGGKGAKWSRDLPEVIAGAKWVSMKYRATALRGGNDYALYIASEPGGQAHEEQYVIRLGDLMADNAWRVQVSQVEIPSVKTLAVQVQATRDNASLQIADIAFHETKPSVRLADVFAYEEGWKQDADSFRVVELPAGNLDGPTLSRKLGYKGWIHDGKITAAGIPFQVRPASDAVIITPTKHIGRIEVPLSGRAAELYLLLAARLGAREEPSFSYGSPPMAAIKQVERFVAHIECGDGAAEDQFPLRIASGSHMIARGLGVYALALEPDKQLRRIVLRDGMRRGAFGLVAATLSETPGPATEATTLKPAVVVPREGPVAARRAGITRTGQRITVEAWGITLYLDCSNGLRASGLANHSRVDAPLEFTPGPLFRLECGDLKLTSEDFTATTINEQRTDTGSRVLIDLLCDAVTPPIKVTVTADTSSPPEIGLQATCDLGGRDHKGTKFIFPELRGLRFSDAPEDTWHWMPRRGDVISNAPISLRAPYAGAENPMQIIGAFGPRQGTGLYMMTQDMNAAPRHYHVQKSGGHVRLGVEYHPYGGGETPRTIIGCNQGDWHEQLERYREWVSTWHKPAAPRKQWFREVFNFRQQFLHFALPTKSGMFDPDTKTFRLKEVVEQNIEAFGGVDYLHVFDWGWDPVHGRCGDYEPWDYLGGADNFKAAVQHVKDMGIPVGLYIEGYLVDPQSNLGKAHGKDWQLLDAKGEPYPYFEPSFNICPWVKDWQDYLSATYARAKRETGALGFYIDQYGFSNPGHFCYNPNHGHDVPVSPVLGEREMTRRVREALGPECAVYTEESPTDVNSQYQDGSFTYNISAASDDWSPTHVNLYRFAFPTFKTIEIIVCDRPLGSNIEAVKRILFNGEAIWIEGIWDKWFTPETRAYIARMHKVLRANRQCFAGDYPTPLVPTLIKGIYANRFQEAFDGSGKTCWTVYNTNFRTARGELIEVRHFPGAEYRDEFTGERIPARIEGETAVLSLQIGPRDVAVISRTASTQ